MAINVKALRLALCEQSLKQWMLAKRLGCSASSLSARLCGARPAPPDFAEQIERALGLPLGSLHQ